MAVRRRWFQQVLPACVSALIAMLGHQIGLAQTPSWCDGTAESDAMRIDDWREASRRQQQRDRAEIDRVRGIRASERGWVWTEQGASSANAPLILFPATSSGPLPIR